MKKCTNCGQKNNNNAKFCKNCGTMLKEEADSLWEKGGEKEKMDWDSFGTTEGKSVPMALVLGAVVLCVLVLAFFFAKQTKQIGGTNQAAAENDVAQAVTETTQPDATEEQQTQPDVTEEQQTVQTAQVTQTTQQQTVGEPVYGGSNYSSSEFIFPQSSSEYLSESDLYGLSAWQLKVARNEIYARNGREFTTQSMREYFNQCSWYQCTWSAESFDQKEETLLNKYEKANRDLIRNYEKKYVK